METTWPYLLFILLSSSLPLVFSDKTPAAAADGGNGQREQESLHSFTFARPSLITPRKLLLFSKALHTIVERHCQRYVDDLELDTFQEYLRRQISKGDVETIRHSSHFNELYRGVSECARRLISKSRQDLDKADFRVGTEPGFEELKSLIRTEKTIIEMTREVPTTTTATASSPVEAATWVKNEVEEIKAGSTATSKRETKTTTAKPFPSSIGISKDGGHGEGVDKKEKATVIDKMVYNATQAVTKMYNASKKFFKDLWGKTKSKSKAWFGRRKRDLTTPYYSKERIQPPLEFKAMPNDDDSLAQIWNRVTAEESRQSGIEHFSGILRDIMEITLSECPEEVDHGFLIKVLELIGHLVEKDLRKMESAGMSLKINEVLEIRLQECVNATSSTEEVVKQNV